MLKPLSICVALAALGVGPIHAQERELCLKTVEVPEAGFDFVVAAPRRGGSDLVDLAEAPDALIMRAQGGKLMVVLDNTGKAVRALRAWSSSASVSEADGDDAASLQPVALYIVPKSRAIADRGTLVDVRPGAKPRWPSLVPNDMAGLP